MDFTNSRNQRHNCHIMRAFVVLMPFCICLCGSVVDVRVSKKDFLGSVHTHHCTCPHQTLPFVVAEQTNVVRFSGFGVDTEDGAPVVMVQLRAS